MEFATIGSNCAVGIMQNQVCSGVRWGHNGGKSNFTCAYSRKKFSRISRLNSIKLGTNYPRVKKTPFLEIKGQVLIKGKRITKNATFKNLSENKDEI